MNTDIRRVLNVNGTITDGASQGALHGPVDQWAGELAAFATTYRFDTFVFWGEGDDQLERFAREVAPAVRERLGVAAPQRRADRPHQPSARYRTTRRRRRVRARSAQQVSWAEGSCRRSEASGARGGVAPNA